MPLDGHSYLVSQGWSGHGTGLRQDSIIRPLAIPQKRTLAGLGKDRDEAFPFWDQFSLLPLSRCFINPVTNLCIENLKSVFSIAAKSIQVKLYKDDEDDSETEDTPIQSSLELTTTGIISNKPPKLGLSATATATTTSSSSNSGINTPAITTTIIPNSLASSSSNLLVAAKKESAKRILYSRFFRGPVLGPDSDEIIKTRTGDETSGWNSNLSGGVKSGSRTPMAIAKSKLTTAGETVVPLKKGTEKLQGEEEQNKGKKRKRSDDNEAKIKEQEGEGEERRKKEKKEKKKKEREEKKEKKEKKRRKRDEKESLKEEEKRERKSKKVKIVELNETSTNIDESKSIPSCEDEELRNGHSEKRKKRKEKDGRPDITGDKEKGRRERKQNRDRKDAEKKVAATTVVSQVIGADGEGLDDYDTRLVYSPVENSENLRSESKKKKKRKRDD
ncbi:hypothetical protein AGABI1DRAFT_128615 [Agaricus bisporus var. burnettii JB137-S8]|uniref:G-patch domain-containing protein n=1 Tax=Agaricus bisporus var. burnettii (strain JB137-S8 / ATCC MYA-4627 / FGSC 10392) TaxID=597362 RepID=K5X8B2_AGABU|nr:uncharacterized protein AGABI1DRAFT_128615 [Agaricus bisporus var. burnettii JB137-S8]EKM79463.1 hypothetical protein AGABI1DRAFT_128615 [Agaricus bisporus var. burnettii JB137-S8]